MGRKRKYETPQEKAAAKKKRQRDNSEKRRKEQEKDTLARAEKRKNPNVRANEQEKDTSARAEKRKYLNVRASEQEKDTIARSAKREDPKVRSNEQEKDTIARSAKREDPDVRADEQQTNTNAHAKKRANSNFEMYEKAVIEEPKFICSSCGRVWYKDSVKSTTTETILGLHGTRNVECLKTDDKFHLCTTCNISVKAGKTPRLCLSNGLWFPEIPECLKGLTSLEERLISPRIPFMQIRSLGADKQYGIRGGVVNVPNIMDKVAKVIPRNFSDTSTVQVQLKRRLKDKHNYMFQTIRPFKVHQAAEYLVNTELYQKQNVFLSPIWKQSKYSELVNFISDPADEDLLEQNTNEETEEIQEDLEIEQQKQVKKEELEGPKDEEEPMELDDEDHSEEEEDLTEEDSTEEDEESNQDSANDNSTNEENLEDDSENDEEIKEEISTSEEESIDEDSEDEAADEDWENTEEDMDGDPPLTETLLTEDLEIISVAPGENMTPLPITMDLEAEELSFATCYCGVCRHLNPEAKLTYTDVANSELRSYDPRCRRADKILYTHRKVLTYRLQNNCNICMRKKRKQGMVTVRDMKNSETVDNLVQQDDGFRVTVNIPNSPASMQEKKKDAMAFIRQRGLPALFITTSAAETQWPELLSMLEYRRSGQRLTDEAAMNLSFEEKADLIRNDAIGCVLAFDHRERALDKYLINHVNGIFAPYKHTDFFKRKEVQQRGSLHTHRMDWLEGAPIFEVDDISSHLKCCCFIDQFITCKNDDSIAELIAYQRHKHSHTCKHKIKGCRFGFPVPPMNKTSILLPLNIDRSTKYQNMYKKLREYLITLGRNAPSIKFEDFLKEVNIDYHDYILAIRSNLKRPKVFLRRETDEIYINQYNKLLLQHWRANVDIQFVLDPYACATYVVNYISKSDRGVSKLLREISQQIKNGNYGLRERLKMLCGTFLSHSEVSAQEAACHLLQIHMVEASRDVVFINTGRPEERVIFVKDQTELMDMDDDSTDISATGLLDRYIIRSDAQENVCLADFAAKFTYAKVKGSRSQQQRKVIGNEVWLQDKSGYVYPREQSRIIRYRRYGEHQDPLSFYREQLMLFIPYRNEVTDLLSVDVEQKYNANLEQIIEHRKEYDPSFLVHEIDDDVLQIEIDENIFGDDSIPFESVEFINQQKQDFGLELGNSGSTTCMKILPPKLETNDIYKSLMAPLNEGQRRYHLDVLHRLKEGTEQFCHLIHGQAGVGKSHLIESLVQTIIRLNQREPGAGGDDIPVMVAAFTGKAAHNVHGVTLHSFAKLPPSQHKGKMGSLDAGTCNSMRVKFRKLKLLIIDEISLVTLKMFFDVDSRLRQIMGVNKTFGGVSTIVVGDFYQLRPVGGRFVFQDSKDILESIMGNSIWSQFSMFQLTEIMRQKEDKYFAEALSRLSRGALTSEDIAMFKTREVDNKRNKLKVPNDATFLFYANLDCDEFNWQAMQKRGTAVYQSTAIDRVQGGKHQDTIDAMMESAKTLNPTQHGGMPYNVQLQIDFPYSISTNIDVTDGLFNGATGFLRAVKEAPLSNGGKAVQLITMEFVDKPHTGANSRTENKKLLFNLGYSQNHTPIFSQLKPLNNWSSEFKGMQIIRRQIPVVPAMAITYHKAQSCTYKNGVAVNITANLPREALYVGCSRAPSWDQLFIIGNFTPPRPIPDNHMVTVELSRLQNKSFPFAMHYLPDIKNVHKVVFHNIASFRAHRDHIINDAVYGCADVLAFCETKTLNSDIVDLEGFQILNRTDSPNIHSSIGTLLLRIDLCSSKIRNIKSWQEGTNNFHIQISSWDQNETTCIMIYRSPSSKKSEFKQVLQTILNERQGKPTIIFGDMNINFASEDSLTYKQDFKRYGFAQTTPPEASTDGNTCIDVCYSNIVGISAWYYESYFSYHKPICITWPLTEPVVISKDSLLMPDYSSKINTSSLLLPMKEMSLERIPTTQIESKIEEIKILNEKDCSNKIHPDIKDSIKENMNINLMAENNYRQQNYKDILQQGTLNTTKLKQTSIVKKKETTIRKNSSQIILGAHSGIENKSNICYIISVGHLFFECSEISDFVFNKTNALCQSFSSILKGISGQPYLDRLNTALHQLSDYLATKDKQYPFGVQQDAYLFLLDMLSEFGDLGLDLQPFTCVINSKVVCDCSNPRTFTDQTVGISVAISGNNLQACVDNTYFDGQEISCTCGSNRYATNSTFEIAPKYLFINIKLFNNEFVKIPTHVNCPDALHLPGANGTSLQYELKAILCHDGNTVNRGHYITCQRRADKQDYIIYNDENVYLSNNVIFDSFVCLYTAK